MAPDEKIIGKNNMITAESYVSVLFCNLEKLSEIDCVIIDFVLLCCTDDSLIQCCLCDDFWHLSLLASSCRVKATCWELFSKAVQSRPKV